MENRSAVARVLGVEGECDDTERECKRVLEMMELFCILIVAVVTWIYMCKNAQNWKTKIKLILLYNLKINFYKNEEPMQHLGKMCLQGC